MSELTTTSYAILGLLNVRPHSAYDLTQQARRSLRFVWPTSESQLYAEPKRLAREGLIRVTNERAAGTRLRKLYTITPAGRRALRAWLTTAPDSPRVEAEVLLRALLADTDDRDTLLAALREGRERTLAEYRDGLQMVASYAEGDGPYPERAQSNVLWWAFVNDFFHLALEWFDFAEREVQTWSDTASRAPSARTRRTITNMLAGERVVPRTVTRR